MLLFDVLAEESKQDIENINISFGNITHTAQVSHVTSVLEKDPPSSWELKKDFGKLALRNTPWLVTLPVGGDTVLNQCGSM